VASAASRSKPTASIRARAPADESCHFGCRIGHVADQDDPACSLAQAAARRSGSALFGARLSPQLARGHPRLGEFWAVTDWLILNDELLHQNVFHMPPASHSQ
jgi:hypothetical protein